MESRPREVAILNPRRQTQMADRLIKIINNDTGTESQYAVVSDERGPKGPTDGGDGGMIPPLWKLDVNRDVQIAKWGLAALLGLIGAFYWIAYMPDMKEIRSDIAGVNTNVAVQTRALNDIDETLGRIEGKVDGNQSQTGPRAGQTGTVHEGAGRGAKPAR